MQNCKVCGRSFDPLGFQVVVPELGRGFDRVECAQKARALGASGLAVAPLVAVGDPLGAALPPAARPAFLFRPILGVPLAALGLLGTGAAAAAYLWVGLLGAGTPNPFNRAAAPPAFGRETVQAHVQRGPGGAAEGRPTGRVATETATRLVAGAGGSPTAPAPAEGPEGSQPPPPDAPPEPPASPPPVVPPSPPPVGQPSRPEEDGEEGAREGDRRHGKSHTKHGEGHGKHGEGHGKHGEGHGKHGEGYGKHGEDHRGHGKGHSKHGEDDQGHGKGHVKGKGHYKHGESDGIHSPGHGGHGEHGHGHGKKKHD